MEEIVKCPLSAHSLCVYITYENVTSLFKPHM